jgi:hypothetical protein
MPGLWGGLALTIPLISPDTLQPRACGRSQFRAAGLPGSTRQDRYILRPTAALVTPAAIVELCYANTGYATIMTQVSNKTPKHTKNITKSVVTGRLWVITRRYPYSQYIHVWLGWNGCWRPIRTQSLQPAEHRVSTGHQQLVYMLLIPTSRMCVCV